jgi:hypothetical protein
MGSEKDAGALVVRLVSYQTAAARLTEVRAEGWNQRMPVRLTDCAVNLGPTKA